MWITSLKEKELYKVRTPIFYDRNAETEREIRGKKGDKKGKNRRSYNYSWVTEKE